MNAFELSGRLDVEAERLAGLSKEVEEAREEFKSGTVPRRAMAAAAEQLKAAADSLIVAREKLASVLGETTRAAIVQLRETKDTAAFLRTVVGRVAAAAVASTGEDEEKPKE